MNITALEAQMVKHLPTMRETQVQYLGWEDPLEKEMATHSSTLAWKIPWMEEHPCSLQLEKAATKTQHSHKQTTTTERVLPRAAFCSLPHQIWILLGLERAVQTVLFLSFSVHTHTTLTHVYT